MARGYSILVLAIVASASVVSGNPQTNVDPSLATPNGDAPIEGVMTCDCVRQINAEVMPGVNIAINGLTSSVDELFKLANATEISPVSVRHKCFFCKRIRRYRTRVHHGHYNTHRYHHRPHHHHHGHHHHFGKRQAEGPQAANIPVCPIDEVVSTAQTAREGTQLVQEVIAGVRADPKEVTQDLLEDIAALYNEVNESVKNLLTATNPNSPECQGEDVSDVAFPGEG